MRNVLYFTPAIFGLVFYSLLAVFSGFGAVHPAVWICIAMLFMSAVLLAKKKWFGCMPGILVGAILIWMSYQYTGQVIIIERPLGIGMVLFYLICCTKCNESNILQYVYDNIDDCREANLVHVIGRKMYFFFTSI